MAMSPVTTSLSQSTVNSLAWFPQVSLIVEGKSKPCSLHVFQIPVD